MRSVSTRFRAPLLACFALAAVAGWLLLLRATRWETCREPERIAGPPAFASTAQATPPDERTDGVFESVIQTLALPGSGLPLKFRVVRSDRPFLLLTNWVGMISPTMDAVETRARWLRVDGESIPIEEVRAVSRHATHITLAFFVYDGRPIDSLLAAQLGHTWQQLVRGTLPLTLYAADGWALAGQEQLVLKTAEEWLAAARKQHQAVCGS